MKKGSRMSILVVAVLLICMSAGCAAERLGGGNCLCKIALDYTPQEFKMLEDNVGELLELDITLKNMEQKKNYTVVLNRDNDYRSQIYLPEGNYKVIDCGAYPTKLVELQLRISEKRFSLEDGQERDLTVSVKNEEAFTDWVWSMQMTRKIGQLDRFSRKIQCNGKVMKLQDIAKNIGFSTERRVKSGKTVTLYNRENEIRLTVKNTGENTRAWSECAIQKIEFEKNNIIFGEGARIGMSVYDIANKEKGIYGIPDELGGSLLFGENQGTTDVIYENEDNGDKLILTSSPDGEYIERITYEFDI